MGVSVNILDDIIRIHAICATTTVSLIYMSMAYMNFSMISSTESVYLPSLISAFLSSTRLCIIILISSSVKAILILPLIVHLLLSYPSLLFSFSINARIPHCESAILTLRSIVAGSVCRRYDIHTAKSCEADRRLRSGSRTREPMILFTSGETRRIL